MTLTLGDEALRDEPHAIQLQCALCGWFTQLVSAFRGQAFEDLGRGVDPHSAAEVDI